MNLSDTSDNSIGNILEKFTNDNPIAHNMNTVPIMNTMPAVLNIKINKSSPLIDPKLIQQFINILLVCLVIISVSGLIVNIAYYLNKYKKNRFSSEKVKKIINITTYGGILLSVAVVGVSLLNNLDNSTLVLIVRENYKKIGLIICANILIGIYNDGLCPNYLRFQSINWFHQFR
jgi:hypothetical protein